MTILLRAREEGSPVKTTPADPWAKVTLAVGGFVLCRIENRSIIKEIVPILGIVDSSGCPQITGGAFIRGCAFIRHITVVSNLLSYMLNMVIQHILTKTSNTHVRGKPGTPHRIVMCQARQSKM